MLLPLVLLGVACAYGHHVGQESGYGGTQHEVCDKEQSAQRDGQSNQGGGGGGGEEAAQSPVAAPASPGSVAAPAPAPAPRSGYNPFTVPLQAQSSPLFLEAPPMVQSSPQSGGGGAPMAAAPVDEAAEFGVVLTPIGGNNGGGESNGPVASAPLSSQGGATDGDRSGQQSGGYRRFNRHMMQIF
ncbi:unnamed protein product [Cylicocyclus nassatus]|uniref:Uncharacterized protein n=1 Tax=Cylicocyclus nassatus TaxID=53992 RepID=A0AA36M8U3_CYLNA|nr:unnamed protein product [Cylicocyclus nassatus]